MKKEASPFRFPEGGGSERRESVPCLERRDSLFSQKLQRVCMERIQMSSESSSSVANDKVSALHSKTLSPLHIPNSRTSSSRNSPVPVEFPEFLPGISERKDISTQETNGFSMEIEQNTDQYHTPEDQEVLEIVRQGEQFRIDCHSITTVRNYIVNLIFIISMHIIISIHWHNLYIYSSTLINNPERPVRNETISLISVYTYHVFISGLRSVYTKPFTLTSQFMILLLADLDLSIHS